MSKQQTKTEPKPTTAASALASAQAAQVDAAQAAEALALAFEIDQSPAAWSRVVSSRSDLEYRDKLLAFAQAAHEKHEAEQAAIERAAAERIRLAALAENTAARSACYLAALEAGKTLIEQLEKSWQLVIEAQGIGGNALNDLPWSLNLALPQIAAEHGLSLRSVVIS